MDHDVRADWPHGGEWTWLWEAYVVGLCVAAIAAVALLNSRFPGNVPGATVALTAMAVFVVVVGRRVTRLPEDSWQTYFFVAIVVALWVAAMAASPVSVAAVPAIYPVVFSTLSLRVALCITTAINLIPLAMLLSAEGTGSPNLPLAIVITLTGVVATPVIGTAIMTSMRQRRAPVSYTHLTLPTNREV